MLLQTVWAKLSGCHIISIDGVIMRLTDSTNTNKGSIIQTSPRPDGYVSFHYSCNGVLKRHYLHRIMCTLFRTAVEGKNYVSHKDHNGSNNSLENIDWCTQSENVLHSCNTSTKAKKAILKHSISLRASKPGKEIRAKIFKTTLASSLVIKIKELSGTMSFSAIGKLLGTSGTMCSRVSFAEEVHILNRRYGKVIEVIELNEDGEYEVKLWQP